MIRQLLSINTVPTKLDLDWPIGKLEMVEPARTSFEAKSAKSEIEITPDPIKFKKDSREMLASMNIYMPDLFRRKTEDEAKDIALQAIGDIGEDWRMITESQGAATKEIFKKNAGWKYTREFIHAFTPVKPDITWEGGTPPKIAFSPYRLDIHWTIIKPEMRFNMGQKNIRVTQYGKVNVEYLGTFDDALTLGRESRQKLNMQI